jgi:hypothetical protein
VSCFLDFSFGGVRDGGGGGRQGARRGRCWRRQCSWRSLIDFQPYGFISSVSCLGSSYSVVRGRAHCSPCCGTLHQVCHAPTIPLSIGVIDIFSLDDCDDLLMQRTPCRTRCPKPSLGAACSPVRPKPSLSEGVVSRPSTRLPSFVALRLPLKEGPVLLGNCPCTGAEVGEAKGRRLAVVGSKAVISLEGVQVYCLRLAPHSQK